MTKTQQRIVEAVARGYRVEGNQLIGPKGPLKIGCHGKQRYPTFSTNWGGMVYGIPIHQFAAYQFYGEAAFVENIQVRHRNGDTLDFSKDNILLGSSSQNQMDKCPLSRKQAAQKARAAQGITPRNAKLSLAQVQEIKAAYASLNGKRAPRGFTKQLTEQYGVSRTVINKVVRGLYYVS